MEKIKEDHLKQLYGNMFDYAQDAMIITGSDGEILLVNNQTRTLFGYTSDELLSSKIERLIHPQMESVDDFKDKFKNGKDMGHGKPCMAIKKNGKAFVVEISLNPVDINGSNYVIVSIRDVTHKVKISEQLNSLDLTLKLKNDHMKQFTYIASHDLQEPLLTIASFVELLQEENEVSTLSEESHYYFNFINNAVKKMQRMIHGMMAYTKLGASNEMTKIDLNVLIRKVSDEYQNTYSHKIFYSLLPTIVGLPREIEILFSELIKNAVEFNEGVPEILIDCVNAKDHWVFTIKDNGIGIAVEHFEKIFKVFHKLHHANEYKGLGLGLFFCQRIVELHDGNIVIAESGLGRGTKVEFSIHKINELDISYHKIESNRIARIK